MEGSRTEQKKNKMHFLLEPKCFLVLVLELLSIPVAVKGIDG